MDGLTPDSPGLGSASEHGGCESQRLHVMMAAQGPDGDESASGSDERTRNMFNIFIGSDDYW